MQLCALNPKPYCEGARTAGISPERAVKNPRVREAKALRCILKRPEEVEGVFGGGGGGGLYCSIKIITKIYDGTLRY